MSQHFKFSVYIRNNRLFFFPGCLLLTLLLSGCKKETPQNLQPSHDNQQQAVNRTLVPPSVELPELSADEVPPALLMTEFLAANDSGLKDGDDDLTDWIEIHNPGQTPLNLSQFALTQDRQLEELWEFPSFLMGSGDYLIVHASGKNRRLPNEEWHTDFKLNADGEFLAIVMKESRSIVHSFGTRYPQQQDDISYGISSDWAPGEFLLDFERSQCLNITKVDEGILRTDVYFFRR